MSAHTCFELCTESLGFESSDGSVGEGEEELEVLPGHLKNEEKVNKELCLEEKEGGEEKEERKRKLSFPPPLRWMRGTEGRQSSYMKSERKDGRLIITEVRIERPEVFQVSRENGRLRFCLAGAQSESEEEEAEAEEEREPVTREGHCSYQLGAWSGARMHNLWWNHRFVTTA